MQVSEDNKLENTGYIPTTYEVLCIIVIQLFISTIPTLLFTGISFFGLTFSLFSSRINWLLYIAIVLGITAILSTLFGVVMIIGDYFDHILYYRDSQSNDYHLLGFKPCNPKELITIIANYNKIYFIGYFLNFLMYPLFFWILVEIFVFKMDHKNIWRALLPLILPTFALIIIFSVYPWRVRYARTLAAFK